MNNWTDLANAIVLQAVQDYRLALRKLILQPYNLSAAHEVKELENFFRNNPYSDINGDYLIARLREEADNDNKRAVETLRIATTDHTA